MLLHVVEIQTASRLAVRLRRPWPLDQPPRNAFIVPSLDRLNTRSSTIYTTWYLDQPCSLQEQEENVGESSAAPSKAMQPSHSSVCEDQTHPVETGLSRSPRFLDRLGSDRFEG
ncbi:hypothetical protein CPLU01_03182 [Colletotrichum plurivorum]|uniref:Uncharacterized protein n=1 Tax=Colletotrichum plurivorum TaxID=2175906 RepID=A0A8H6NLL8_9PEZI|nr:hypothetical protein CPLU01_03182 [Colletotrichum plurivorum]